jgi:hypothetical protein
MPVPKQGFPRFDCAVAQLEQEGALNHGLQCCVIAGGDTLIDIDNIAPTALRHPAAPELGSLSLLHCAGKIIVALAILLEDVDGRLSIDTPVAEILRDFAGGPRPITIRHLLSHTAGLPQYEGPELRAENRDEIERFLVEMSPMPDHAVGQSMHYDVFAGSQILISVLESRYPGSVRRHLVGMLADLGIQDFILPGLSDTEFESVRARVIFPIGPDGKAVEFPTSSGDLLAPYYAYLSLGSARGLAALYWQFLCAGSQRIRAAVHKMTEAGPPLRDSFSGLIVRHGTGVFVDLSRTLTGKYLSPESFGLSGLHGVVTSFCDPAKNLSVGFIFPDCMDNGVKSLRRRAKLVDAIYEDLADDSIRPPSPTYVYRNICGQIRLVERTSLSSVSRPRSMSPY